MKKIYIGILSVGLLGVSCEKDYTCNCTSVYTFTIGGSTSTVTSTDTYKVNEAKTHEAQAACNEATVVSTSGNGSTETTCELSK